MLYIIFFFFISIYISFMKNIINISLMILNLTILFLIFFFKMASGSSLMSSSNQIYPFFSDFTSFLLVSLSLLVILFSCLASMSHINKKSLNFYFFLLITIVLILSLFFWMWNLLIFFMLFEFVLLPMVLIIVLWSSQSERLLANYYFLLYTILGSFPLMLITLSVSMKGQSNYLVQLLNIEPEIKFFFFFCFLIAFFCKLPIWGLHIWLPKAHVEAPVGGSMVLASLLLKMSGYSVLRFMWVIFVSSSFLLIFFFSLLMMSMIYPLIICFRQSDIKSLVAYSSVSHMCAAVLGLLLFSIYSFMSAFIVFLGHGFISPGMFFLSNLIYERLGSRMILGMGSYEKVTKLFIFFFVFFFIANMGYPPFISFFSELCIYFNLLLYSFYLSLFIFIFVLISSVVMFYFIAKLMKSKKQQNFYKMFLFTSDIYCFEHNYLSFNNNFIISLFLSF